MSNVYSVEQIALEVDDVTLSPVDVVASLEVALSPQTETQTVTLEIPGLQGPKGQIGPPGVVATVRSDTTGGYSYIGSAELGTLNSQTGWTITRISLTDPVGQTEQATNALWNDRLTEVYN